MISRRFIFLFQEWEPVEFDHRIGDPVAIVRIADGFGDEQYNLTMSASRPHIGSSRLYSVPRIVSEGGEAYHDW